MVSGHHTQAKNRWHIEGASNIENMYMLNVLRNLASSLENELCTDVHPILLDFLSTECADRPTLALQPLKDVNKYQLERLIKELAFNPNSFTSYILPR